MSKLSLLPLEKVTHRVLLLRGQKVLLDADLAALYGVETKVLLQAIKRNLERFPEDFMFPLTMEEWATLRSQSVTSNEKPGGRGGRRYAPYAFTEQGVAMLSSILSSPQAVQVNIAIMRAFVKLRELAVTHHDLAKQLNALEEKTEIMALQHDSLDVVSHNVVHRQTETRNWRQVLGRRVRAEIIIVPDKERQLEGTGV